LASDFTESSGKKKRRTVFHSRRAARSAGDNSRKFPVTSKNGEKMATQRKDSIEETMEKRRKRD